MDLIAPELLAAAICVPLALLFALRAPLIVPFGVYVALIPFDNVLGNNGATLVRGLGIISALAIVFRIALLQSAVAPPRAWYYWTALIGWMATTALWTIDSALTITAFGQIFQLFLLYTLLSIYPVTPKEFGHLVTVVILSGIGSSFYGLYQFAQGNRLKERLSITNDTGLTVDPNHYAAALILPICLALVIALARGRAWGRFFALTALLIMATGLLLAGSRGAFISLGILLVYIAWRSRRRLQIVAMGAVALGISLLYPTVWQRFSDPTQGMGAGRVYIWNIGFKALHDHWLIGAGVGAFSTAYNKVFLSGYQAVFQGWSRPSHNVLIGSAVELGLFGAILLVLAWYNTWLDTRAVPQRVAGMPVRLGIEAAIFALFFASMFIDTLAFKYLWLAFTMATLAHNAAMPRFFTRTRVKITSDVQVVRRGGITIPRRVDVRVPAAAAIAQRRAALAEGRART